MEKGGRHMKLGLSPEEFMAVLSFSIPIGVLVGVAIVVFAIKTRRIDLKNPAKYAKSAVIIGLPIGVVFVLIPLWCADFLPMKAKMIITLASLVFGAGSTYSIHLLAKAFSQMINRRKEDDQK
jgi:cyanate permease